MELIFAPEDRSRPLRLGSWICLSIPGATSDQKMHCRVIDALYPVVRLGPPIICGAFKVEHMPTVSRLAANPMETTSTLTPAATPPPGLPRTSTVSKLPEIDFVVYDQNFDDLPTDGKQKIIRMLLDTLPSITELKEYLQKDRHTTVNSWTNRLSPAALGVLRWIIASNRSCIIQVDNLDGDSKKIPEERVTGMPEYMQFRFAQGAPDKEQRFISSMRKELPQMIDPSYPTIFAWHGSSLYNWHSIVREGLHFNHVVNGRAYGNGVYFSPQAQTSLGYSGAYYSVTASWGSSRDENTGNPWMWPHSQLRISDALSLNEIVNRPDKFQSQSPHLVVAQLDWIQTRYLFVRCNNSDISQATKDEVFPTEVYEQDPRYTAMGAANARVVIPITAVSKSRRPSTSVKSAGKKKAKLAIDMSSVELSDNTDVEDVSIFFPDEDETQAAKPASASQGKKVSLAKAEPPKTDFRPGTLDHSTLPMLESPSYATTTASKTLQKELQSTLKIQDSTPLHELGWYIDRELIANVYQWIVELHSFEPSLPLARDMKSRDLKSIILEIRFPGTYPMAPPFVRVIRPRFLSFMAGGGGHVTAGGALCMELLTNSGWSVASNIESVLVQVRAAISSTDPKPARLEAGPVTDYGRGEAVDAYVRACQAHGWSVPKDFMQNYGGGPSSGGGSVGY